MEAIDFDDMPDKHLRIWLGHLREDIPTNGFRNVRGLKEGAINSALKRIDREASLRSRLDDAEAVLAKMKCRNPKCMDGWTEDDLNAYPCTWCGGTGKHPDASAYFERWK